MALNTSHFKQAQSTKTVASTQASGEPIAQEYFMIAGGVAVFAVFFLVAVMLYWRKLKREAVPEF